MDSSLMWVALGLVLLVVGVKLAGKMAKVALFLGVVAALIFWFHEDLALLYTTYAPYLAGSL